jgi:hypothetical protein
LNTVHRILTATFDVVLTPFELLGDGGALVLVSGIFGILALLLFKQISWQKRIKFTKDRIKGNMIAIRIYQDDLAIVFRSVLNVLLRNFQYLALNFGPILPLFAPFVLVASQLVVRYAFDPLPVVDAAAAEAWLPGRGVMLDIQLKPERAAEVKDLRVELPSHLVALSPLARNASDGVAVMEFAAIAEGTADVKLWIGDRLVGTKSVSAGSHAPRSFQPERVSSFWTSWLWPAEPTFPHDSPLDTVSFLYPERDLGFLPGGPFGILVTFFLASIVFGIAVLKPLNIQI